MLITSDQVQPDRSILEPFPVSFVDRLMNFVSRLPVPYWLTYLLLFILQSVISHVVAWMDGWLAPFTFSSIVIVLPLWLWGPLALMTYLNSIALDALSSFMPLLDKQDESLQQLKFEFSNMPARNVVISSLFWGFFYFILVYLIYPHFSAAYVPGALWTVVVFIEGLFSFSIGSAIYYHSTRQLLLVNRTVRIVKNFNLFHLDPVYAFSRVTSQTGIAWVFLFSMTILLFPVQFDSLPVLSMLIVQLGLAVSAFMLPLWFVHHRLVLEKRSLISKHNQRVEATLGKLHSCLDKNELDQVERFYNALKGLEEERNFLNLIPTWPWRTGMLAGFLSAIMLPIVLFLMQIALRKLLNI